jgi:hypothetical protein
MDFNKLFENAFDSINFNFEFDSNEIDESELHSEKHFRPRISTLAGIRIDFNEYFENASDSIPNWAEMKLRKVIYRKKRHLNRCFRHMRER